MHKSPRILLSFAFFLMVSGVYAQAFSTLKLTSLHNYEIVDGAFNRSLVGLSPEIGYEAYNYSYQLEIAAYIPRQIDSMVYVYDSLFGYGFDAPVSETMTIFTIGLMSRYYLFSDWMPVNRLYTVSGIMGVFEHVNQDFIAGGLSEGKKFTNKSLDLTFGLGFETLIDDYLMPFIETSVYFPVAQGENPYNTVYDITEGYGVRIAGGVKLYLSDM
ncbi:MAG TPA: hypothetical protein PK511_03730 [Chitinophagales bacterium]|nr:hypothetical protein [Chitinophagales bacterium]HNK97504.1 hypothetical protein [Chitinophagales bacterium]